MNPFNVEPHLGIHRLWMQGNGLRACSEHDEWGVEMRLSQSIVQKPTHLDVIRVSAFVILSNTYRCNTFIIPFVQIACGGLWHFIVLVWFAIPKENYKFNRWIDQYSGSSGERAHSQRSKSPDLYRSNSWSMICNRYWSERIHRIHSTFILHRTMRFAGKCITPHHYAFIVHLVHNVCLCGCVWIYPISFCFHYHCYAL